LFFFANRFIYMILSEWLIWYNDKLFFIEGRENILYVDSIEACGQHCLTVSRCITVVYGPKARVCWLKSTVTNQWFADDRNTVVVVIIKNIIANWFISFCEELHLSTVCREERFITYKYCSTSVCRVYIYEENNFDECFGLIEQRT
jgi:hypothetical protein